MKKYFPPDSDDEDDTYTDSEIVLKIQKEITKMKKQIKKRIKRVKHEFQKL